ncbi:MAG: ATP-grasp domain-containing protein [Chitinophagaceae bacterium]|nr:ATP-grasp domain-containing protein [Chitinophagaceae bacterium]
MINVLVTSLGSNTAIGVIKALRYQKDIAVTGTDSFPAHLSAGSTFADHFYQVPLAVDNDYEDQLLRIITERQVQCVIPIHDAEVMKIAEIAVKFPALTFWAVNAPRIITMCNNKRTVNQFLAGHGITVPEMFEKADNMLYPAIYKPDEGVSSKGIQVITNAQAGKTGFDLGSGFLQKMITGVEYTVDCYSAYHEEYFNCCVRKRIETKEGISTKGETVEYPLLAQISAKIHRLLQYKGASNIQFIVEDGVPYFIEINPRFSGAGILSYYAGLNSPLFTVLEAVQSPLFHELKNIPIKKGIFMTRYWNENFYEG